MSSHVILFFIGAGLFLFQVIFFIFCIKWLQRAKLRRDKDFAILDKQRLQLIDIQSALNQEVLQAKDLAHGTLGKLRMIGAEAHAEWEEMTKRINTVLVDVDQRFEAILESSISNLTMSSMALEKTMQDAQLLNDELSSATKKAQKVMRLFDSSTPSEEIFKEIQTEKYAEAKRLLCEGIDATAVVKKLGLSMGEVVLLSSYLK
jgi:hypothetical protein